MQIRVITEGGVAEAAAIAHIKLFNVHPEEKERKESSYSIK